MNSLPACPHCGSTPVRDEVYLSIGCTNSMCSMRPWTNHCTDDGTDVWKQEAEGAWLNLVRAAKKRMSTIVDKLAFVLVLCCCSLASGQIKLSEVRTQTWVGFENPVVVNGSVIAGVNSRPTVAASSTLILVETAIPYKFSQVKAQRLPTLDKVTLEAADGGYRFKPGTPSGTYRVEYLAFDPDKGIASEEITVELGSGPEPVLPVDPDLPVLTKESRRVMLEFVHAMADDMDQAAAAAKSGTVKTVLELASVTTKADVATRSAFKTGMGKLLEPKLGNAALPADADKTLQQVANGFRSLK